MSDELVFEKEIDIDVSAEVDLKVDIEFNKEKNVDIDVKTDVDLDDNLTEVFVSAEAIGDKSLVEVDAIVLTTDYMSSAELSIIAAVD